MTAFSLGLGYLEGDRRVLAAALGRTARTGHAPAVSAVLGALAASARGTGPLSADVTSVAAADLAAVGAALMACLVAERARGGIAVPALAHLHTEWMTWVRHLHEVS